MRYDMEHDLRAKIAYNDTSIVPNFLFVPTCDWKLTNKLAVTGILRLPLDKERRTYLIDVRHDGQANQRLRYHEERQSKQLPCRQRGWVRRLEKKRSTFIILSDDFLGWHGSDGRTKQRMGLGMRVPISGFSVGI